MGLALSISGKFRKQSGRMGSIDSLINLLHETGAPIDGYGLIDSPHSASTFEERPRLPSKCLLSKNDHQVLPLKLRSLREDLKNLRDWLSK